MILEARRMTLDRTVLRWSSSPFTKMWHEHSYQFCSRASDWSCPTFAQVPRQFEPVDSSCH